MFLCYGDIICIKSWEELEKEFPQDQEGNLKIKTGVWFNKNMKFLCNQKCKVLEMIGEDIIVDIDTKGWTIISEMIKKVEAIY